MTTDNNFERAYRMKTQQQEAEESLLKIISAIEPTPLKKSNPYSILIWIAILIFALMFMSCDPVHAEEIDMVKIAMIESSGNPLAHRKADDSIGLYQITPIVLKEWNNFHPGNQHKRSHLWNPAINEKIAKWYINVRIPKMIKHYGKPDTIENRIISYNAGISYLVTGKRLPKTTKQYLAKYRK